MLKRLYVDNFRCLLDFELNFDSINLFLGDNGAGKSTVFDVLEKLQLLITSGDAVEEIFKQSDFTRWRSNEKQTFELEVSGNNGHYKYQLEVGKIDSIIEEDFVFTNKYILNERLFFNQDLLLNVEEEKVEFYSDDGIKYSSTRYNHSQSIISILRSSSENKKLVWFRHKIKNLVILKISPNLIVSVSSQKNSFLTKKMENFVSWYRYMFAENQNKLTQLTESLQEILDGFISFRLEPISEKAVILKLIFKTEESDQNIEYTFEELSDGQKVLVVLYSLFYGLESQDYTLCIDEPENFLALPEIQPWLFQLYDLCSAGKLQALLISHHPELIDYLLASPVGYWFKRESNSPVQVTPIDNNFLQPVINNIQKDNKSGLKMSELIARGWLDE
ncbi:MAG: AAA family ATPase [Snowella sp.]|nr:AAA family ATPase [Snowella sp.]